MNLKELVRRTPAFGSEIASLCGISYQAYCRAVYSNAKPHRRKIIKACKAFDTDLQIKLKSLLDNCKHSVPTIAEYSGYSRQSIYRWSRGECAFTQSNFKDIVDTVEYLNAKQ